MAYYASHNLAYDLNLFEDYPVKPTARANEESGEKAVAAENSVSVKQEKQENRRTPSRKRAKTVGRKKSRIGRIVFGVILSIAVMAVIVSIIQGQVQLTELNQEIVNARAELAEKQSIYTQLEMKVDSSVSTTVVEEYARDKLAMSKANNSQKEFVSLSDGDKAEVTMTEDKNLFERIGDFFASLFT